MIVIEPTIGKSILVHLGQLFFTPFTKAIIESTKHGIKTKSNAHPMTIRMSINSHITMNIPKNAMNLSFKYYKPNLR